MPSFKNTKDLLLLAHYDKLVDDEELLLLWDINTSGNPEFPYKSYEPFNLEDQDDAECKSNFCFEKQDISILGDALQIPEFFTCYQGTKCSGIEGLCIVLRRFAYFALLTALCARFAVLEKINDLFTMDISECTPSSFSQSLYLME